MDESNAKPAENPSNPPNNSPERRLTVLEMQKLLSGETKHSHKARFLSIEEQIRLGIPTDSVTLNFNPLRKKQ
jgi:hypothetical protein